MVTFSLAADTPCVAVLVEESCGCLVDIVSIVCKRTTVMFPMGWNLPIKCQIKVGVGKRCERGQACHSLQKRFKSVEIISSFSTEIAGAGFKLTGFLYG